jgi:hypothetical protein
MPVVEGQGRDTAPSSTLKRRVFLGVGVGLLGAATVTVAGIQNRWWPVEPTLSIRVKVPFSDDEPVSLRAYRSSFMEPHSVQVIMADRQAAIVGLEFVFKGEQDASRRINVSISLRDPAGKIIGSQRLVCEDARIGADKPIAAGSTRMTRVPGNADSVNIPLAEPSQIASVDLLFEST